MNAFLANSAAGRTAGFIAVDNFNRRAGALLGSVVADLAVSASVGVDVGETVVDFVGGRNADAVFTDPGIHADQTAVSVASDAVLVVGGTLQRYRNKIQNCHKKNFHIIEYSVKV